MKAIHWIGAAALLAYSLPAPALAGLGDPEITIYRFSGVRDNGGGENVGVATSFHCTNFSGATENIRFVTRNSDGTIKSNVVLQVPHLNTPTISTHPTNAYIDNGGTLATGAVTQGTTAIAATSINVICTAMTIDAANPKPDGLVLRAIRFNPVPGSQE